MHKSGAHMDPVREAGAHMGTVHEDNYEILSIPSNVTCTAKLALNL